MCWVWGVFSYLEINGWWGILVLRWIDIGIGLIEWGDLGEILREY